MSLTLYWVLLSLPWMSFSTPLTRHPRQTMDLPPMDNSNDTVAQVPGGFLFPAVGGSLCVDMCSMPWAYCENGETCQFNDTTCESTCLCSPGLDPQNRCMNTSLPTTTTVNTDHLPTATTLRPPHERNCNGRWLVAACQHGICVAINETGGFMCSCDKNFTGDFCADSCTRDCGSHGDCRLDSVTHVQYCSCLWPWQGNKCEEPPPDTHVDYAWIYWLGGGLGVGLLLLLGGGVTLMVFLWRRRFILIMKIVHYFQPYEDADGKLFDAFVSYRSSPEDLSFVYNHLRHKLEGDMNFRLCLHERDFHVGEPIANNIIWATENSRRTILVISPRYLESEWARMEYQRAQYETLKRKQRIIPVMLEDVSNFGDNMDPNLAYILKTVTYLEHPGPTADSKEMEKFWKRLQLSMPKKRDTSSSTSLAENDATPMSILSNGDLIKTQDNSPTDPAHVVLEHMT